MKFTHSHEWIRFSGKVGTVGITQHGREELNEIVFIELPKIGQEVNIGEEVCVLESTKAAIDVYSPVSGKIIAVNEALKEAPSKIQSKAERDCWLYQIELYNLKELEELLSELQYRQLISS